MPKAQLVELYAHRLGIIDDARLDFGDGFNVITGETGAGKTLLLGALALALGSEASLSRHALSDDTRAVALFARGEGEELVFTRELTATGRLRSSLNGAPTSAEAQRQLAEQLIVVHGQHDSLALRRKGEALRLVDQFGRVDTEELSHVRQALREARRLRDDVGGDRATREREVEFLEFQLKELDDAGIRSPTELFETLDELTRLSTLRDGQASLEEALRHFDGDADDAVLNRFAQTMNEIPSGEAYEGPRRALRDALTQAREAIHELSALTNPETFDPERLSELEERASFLQLLARKYGGSLERALSTQRELRARREQLVTEEARLDGLDQEIQNLEVQELHYGARARRDRETAGARLSEAITAQLSRVALEHATLRFVVDGDDGSEVEILFAPNPGLGEGSLAALGSGGELSRVLLAISLEVANPDIVAVFDEIDAGLGGQVAQQIGECLAEIGRRQQVLAITHLASVAAKADHHFVIEKSVMDGVTSTSIRSLTRTERVDEIARMLAGDERTDESRALAQQMLENISEHRTGAGFPR
jgi:DNA repair protein RecN (Recombination protein N)